MTEHINHSLDELIEFGECEEMTTGNMGATLQKGFLDTEANKKPRKLKKVPKSVSKAWGKASSTVLSMADAPTLLSIAVT